MQDLPGNGLGASVGKCAGPHAECSACNGHQTVHSSALYVSGSRGQTAAALRGCWHCRSRGYYCRAEPRCHPDHP